LYQYRAKSQGETTAIRAIEVRAEGNLEGRRKIIESVNPCLTGFLSKTYRDSDRWGDAQMGFNVRCVSLVCVFEVSFRKR
jgi:hypothetical protein